MQKRKTSQIDGQMYFEICLDKDNCICQKNELIVARQSLSLNSAKIIRAAMMNVMKNDMDFKAYVIHVPELAKMLNTDSADLYHKVKELSHEININPIKMFDSKNKKNWTEIPWVQLCKYTSGVGFTIKLNQELKPYLLALKDNYTQYFFSEIIQFSSVYAIRIFELLQERIKVKLLPLEGIDIDITIKDIRDVCDLYNYDSKGEKVVSDKFTRISEFKKKVVDIAVREINNKSSYQVSYTDIKRGKSIYGFRFHVNTELHEDLIYKKSDAEIQEIKERADAKVKQLKAKEQN